MISTKTKGLIILSSLLLVIMVPFMDYSIPFAKAAFDPWYNLQWFARIQLNVTSPWGHVKDYVLNYTLHRGVGTSSGNDIYLQNNSRADLADIRFVATDGVTVYPHWNEDNSSWVFPNCTTWVLVPDIPASPAVTTFYCYWGNPLAVDTSDGNLVFPFFDDFEVDLDVGDWLNVSGGAPANGWPIIPANNSWYIEVEAVANNGGWSAIECNDRQILPANASNDFGWSMEFDGYYRTYLAAAGSTWCLSVLGNDWMHDPGAAQRDNNLNATSYEMIDGAVGAKYSEINTWDRDGTGQDWYKRWQIIPNNYNSWASLSTARGVQPHNWTRHQIVMFNGTGVATYVRVNGTMMHWLNNIWPNLALPLGPTFSSKSWAGAADYLRLGSNWVFMRPIADPEPETTTGSIQNLLVTSGISNLEGCGIYVFEGKKQYTFWVNVTSLGAGSGANFSAGHGFYDDENAFHSWFYNETTDTVDVESPDYAILSSYIITRTYDTDWLYLEFNVTFGPTVQDTFNIDIYVRTVVPGLGDSGWVVNMPNYFHIYNKGEYGEYRIWGDGGRVAGGSFFDLIGNDSSTGPGSGAECNVTWRKFNHMSATVKWWIGSDWSVNHYVCPQEHANTGWVSYVLYYCHNHTWIEGPRLNMTIVDGSANGNHAWVLINAEWTNVGVHVRTQQFYAYYESHEQNDNLTQVTLFVDLWMDRGNASSMVGGRVSAKYYGIDDVGWLWWANWRPKFSSRYMSKMSDNLYSANRTWIINAESISLFKVGAIINKTSADAGATPCDLHKWAIYEHEVVWNIAQDWEFTLGIDEPMMSNPQVPYDMVPDLLSRLAHVMVNTITKPLLELTARTEGVGVWRDSARVFNTIARRFGFIGDALSIPSSILSTLMPYLTVGTQHYLSLINNFLRLFLQISTVIIDWFGRIVTTFIQISRIVVQIFEGTATLFGVVSGVGNVFTLMNLNSWIDAIPLFMFIAWFASIDRRAKTLGGWVSVLWGDVSIMISVLSFIMDVFITVVNMILDFIMRYMPWTERVIS